MNGITKINDLIYEHERELKNQDNFNLLVAKLDTIKDLLQELLAVIKEDV